MVLVVFSKLIERLARALDNDECKFNHEKIYLSKCKSHFTIIHMVSLKDLGQKTELLNMS